MSQTCSSLLAMRSSTSRSRPVLRCSTSTINDLDDYSLYLIFSKLTFIEKISAESVCKKWFNLISNLIHSQISLGNNMICSSCDDIRHQVSSYECIGNVFDSAIECSVKWYFITGVKLCSVLSKCPKLKSLILQNCIFCRDVLEVFSNHCSTNLEHLDLSYSSCNINEILQTVSDKCRQTLKHVMLKDNEINEFGLNSLIRSCAELEVLVLDNNEGITGECFINFGTKINYLSIVDCISITDIGINSLINGNGKNIKHLRIGSSVTPLLLRLICEQLTELKSLELDRYKTETPNSYSCISLLTSLRELILTIPRIAFDAQLNDIIRNCRQLKKVKIDGPVISDASLNQFAIHCPNIEQISIAPPIGLTNSLITDECRFDMSTLRCLRMLSLCSSYITDEFVKALRSSQSLCFLELDRCKYLTNLSLEACVEMALSRPNHKIMLFVQRTNIAKPSFTTPSNLNIFGSWSI